LADVVGRRSLEGAHEKGGVEGEIGYFRRNHLVPIPVVRDWDHLIEICRLASIEEESRHLDGRTESIGEMWAQERAHLLSWPGERFDSALRVTARVDAKGRVMVLRNRYSAPVMLTGCVVEAVVHSREVVIQHGGKEIGRHPRRYGVGGDRLVLDHYLEVLRYKPRARRVNPAESGHRRRQLPCTLRHVLRQIAAPLRAERRSPADGRRAVPPPRARCAVAACEQGRSVRFTTVAALVNELLEARDERTLSRVVSRWSRFDLLIADELGYVTLPSTGAELLFQILAQRSEARSVIITTNLLFSEWTNVFSDPRLCKAIVERLTYRSHIVETGTESYRFKQSVNRHNGALRTTPRATSRTRAAHSANGPRNSLPAASTT